MKITYASNAVKEQCRTLRRMQPAKEYPYFSGCMQALVNRGLMTKRQYQHGFYFTLTPLGEKIAAQVRSL